MAAAGSGSYSGPAQLLIDCFDRIGDAVGEAIKDLSSDQLAARPDGHANSIAWLVWHLTRVQDDHIAAAFRVEQLWTAQGWAHRFALPFDLDAIGYGHDHEDVAALGQAALSAQLLADYHGAVRAMTIGHLSPLTDADLDRVVDSSYSPPVTLGVRLVSVVADDLQHAGQAAFVRGLILS